MRTSAEMQCLRVAVFLLVSAGGGVWAQSAPGRPSRAAGTRVQGRTTEVKVHAEGDAGLRGELPLDSRAVKDPADKSLASGVVAASAGVSIKAETPLSVSLGELVSSAMRRNGDTVPGVLLEPVRTSQGGVLGAGTPVKAAVVSAARAGAMESGGVLSLQVVEVGGIAVESNVLEFEGQDGRKDVADAAPAKGTEASVQAGSVLRFTVLGTGETFEGGGTGNKPAHGAVSPATVGVGPGQVAQPGEVGAGSAAPPR